MFRDTQVIHIAPYDPRWPDRFLNERNQLLSCPDCPFLEIEHIGSTSVPGLVAKPVIDLMASATLLEEVEAFLPQLKKLGYQPLDGGFRRRRSFGRSANEGSEAYNLHIVPACQWADKDERLFRDWLCSHPSVVQEYAALKKELAAMNLPTIADYTDAKGEFIRSEIQKARAAFGKPRRTDWRE